MINVVNNVYILPLGQSLVPVVVGESYYKKNIENNINHKNNFDRKNGNNVKLFALHDFDGLKKLPLSPWVENKDWSIDKVDSYVSGSKINDGKQNIKSLLSSNNELHNLRQQNGISSNQMPLLEKRFALTQR